MKKKCGAIYNKICYAKYRKPTNRRLKRNETDLPAADENENIVDNGQSDVDLDELNFLLYFKTCLVDRDLEILKIKLAQSIKIRESLLEKKIVDLHKTFPFFFIEPKLVSSKKC